MHVALKLCHAWPKHGISLPVSGDTWVATAISLRSRGNDIMTPCLIAWHQIKHDTMFDCMVSNMTPCLIAWYQIKHDTMFDCMVSNQTWHHVWLHGIKSNMTPCLIAWYQIKHDTMFDCMISNQTCQSNTTPCLSGNNWIKYTVCRDIQCLLCIYIYKYSYIRIIIYIHLFNLPAVLSLFRCKLTHLMACIKEKEAFEAISSISSSDVTDLDINLEDPWTHSLGLLQDKFETLGMCNTWAFGATVHCDSLLQQFIVTVYCNSLL